MQHLNLESVARLVDELPSEDEALHLATCAECREELEGMREQVGHLGGLPSLSVPAGLWPSLRSRLAPEGMLSGRALANRSGWRGTALRMAAALALFVGGGVTSEMLRGAPGGAGGLRSVVAEVSTPEEAQEALLATEAAYAEALTRYAELTGNDVSGDPLNRLAALEGIVLTTRAALKEAPADPVINGYHLTALTQREAMLRQISRTSGEGWF